jgi:hypothetical protein
VDNLLCLHPFYKVSCRRFAKQRFVKQMSKSDNRNVVDVASIEVSLEENCAICNWPKNN